MNIKRIFGRYWYLLLVIVGIIIMCTVCTREEKQRKYLDYRDNIVVINSTDYDKFVVDTTIMTVFEYIFRIDSSKKICINVTYLPVHLNTGDIEYKAISENINDSIYSVYLDRDLNDRELYVVLCHESIHLKQYMDKRLILNKGSKDSVLFDDKLYFASSDYYNRPWEKEAYNSQYKLVKILKGLLYEK